MAKVKKLDTEEKTVEKGTVKEEKNLKAPEKLTYEQLEQLASQYYGKTKALEERLNETQNKLLEATSQLEMFQKNEYWMRIDLLWRIINLEGSNEIFGNEFIDTVCNEFKSRVYPPKIKEEKRNTEE